ncbi:hypothetical protein HY972_00835 [Candidatus Kaiserbacteria bacterium]|nr:hypothetical protein [Candidatus Kaiserbacteria bacterium]
MRRFLSSSFVALVLLVGAAGVGTPVAHAEPRPGQACDLGAPGSGGGVYQVDGTCVTSENYVSQSNPAAGTPSTLPPSSDLGEGFGKIMTWIMSLFAWLVGVAAMTLDYAVYFTVVTMGDYVNKLSAVGVTWRILRDIGNIVLIFGFLAVGISIILNTERLGYGKKMLPMLLVAAVFLNFSLFFAEAVIDTGNLFATQFFTQINGGNPVTPDFLAKLNTSPENEGISNKIMDQIGLQSIYGQGRVNTGVFTSGNSWIIGFMGTILFLITAFVMFSLAFVLIARFVILLFLIIIAPIGFAGLAVPKLASSAGKWWSTLFEQTITAPVLLLLLYIALAVITDVNFLTGICAPSTPGATCTKDWTGFVGGNDLTGFASLMLSFLVAMGLLLAVVIVSKKISAFGAAGATKLAGKLTFGATAFGMRSTVGAGSQYLSRKVRSSSWGETKRGRLLASTFDRGAKASFDVRGTGVLGKLPYGGVDAGAAQKGGYRARQEKSVKGHEEYAKSLTGRETARTENTREEDKAIKDAEIKRTTAQGSHDMAKSEHDTATKERDRIAEEKRGDRYWDTDPKNQEKLMAAEAGVVRALEKVTKTEEELSKATEAKTNVEKSIEAKKESEVRPAGAKARREQYAKNIEGSLAGWALFGPGGSEAAKKIRTSKPNKDKLEELIKEMAREEKEAEDRAKTSAPAAPKP